MNQITTNSPLDNRNLAIASKNDELSKKYYYLIMDLLQEIPNILTNGLLPLDNNIDYYTIGANVTWVNRTQSQSQSYIRLFVDKNNNIYLPELYPYHDSSSNFSVSITENKFMVFKANEKAKGLIESILKDVR